MKILIVDDSRENVYLLEALLKGNGYETVGVWNGAEAMTQLRFQRFDLIISDIMMPVMDGFQFCRQVKQDINLKIIPFVFYTATYTEAKDEELALKAGADKFIRKPIEPEEFLREIQAVLKNLKEGQLEVKNPPEVEEKEFIKLYDERLVNKLEHKVLELEKANADLKKAQETLQRYNRELEEVNKELEAFNYSVSHDLRQPLRALGNYSDLLLMEYKDKLDAAGQDYMNRVIKAGQYMSQLTDDLLKLSRVVRADLYSNEINLSEIAQSIFEELNANQAGRTVEIRISPNMIVNGDRELITVALKNLLENAWKFTSKCPQARIEVGQLEKDGETVYFVRDNGSGFDMKYKDKLFQPFQRLHTDKEYPGTGIGLAIVQRIVRRHGGKIWAESEKEKGATFYFTLNRKGN